MGIKILILYIGVFCSAATFTAAQERVHNGQAQKAAAKANTQAQTQATAKHFTDTLQLHFKVGKSNLDPKIGKNAGTLQHLQKFQPQKNKFIIHTLAIRGGSSPEGNPELNRRLAHQRANSAMEYLRNTIGIRENIATEEPSTPTHSEVQNLYPDKTSRELHNMVFPNLRVANLLLTYSRKGPEPKLGYTTKAPEAQAESLQPQNLPALPEPAKPAEPEPEETNKYILAIKTNLLYDALLTPNIGVEIPILKNWSIAGNWMYAWWKADPDSWYHRIYGGDIEIRRWLYTTAPLTGWHIGAYGQMLTYDFEWGGDGVLGDKWSYAAGLAVGYSKNLAPKLNIDFTLGVGYLTGEYKEYKPIDNCYVWQATKHRHWVGPTKAEVSLVWLLGKW